MLKISRLFHHRNPSMQMLSSTFNRLFATTPETSGVTHVFRDPIPFVDSCRSCPAECSNPNHEWLPPFLQKKISDEPMQGTLKDYKLHIGVCFGTSTSWESKFAEAKEATLARKISDTLQSSHLEDRLSGRVVLTAIERRVVIENGREIELVPEADLATTSFEVLLFPVHLSIGVMTLDQFRDFLARLTSKNIDNEEALMELSAESRKLPPQIVLVCSHSRRDKRCGVGGPILIAKFRQSISTLELQESVRVYGCSHVGGHKFAGNVIVYPVKDWYGRVTSHDVDGFVDQVLVGGKVVSGLWRGRMGLPETKE